MSRDMDDILREEGPNAARAFRDSAKPFLPEINGNGHGGGPGWQPDAEPASPEPDEEPTVGDGISLDDFYAYMPQHSYIFAPTDRNLFAGR